MSTYFIKLLSYTIVITYKSLSGMLVSPNLKVVTTIDSVITGALGSIVLTYYSFLP